MAGIFVVFVPPISFPWRTRHTADSACLGNRIDGISWLRLQQLVRQRHHGPLDISTALSLLESHSFIGCQSARDPKFAVTVCDALRSRAAHPVRELVFAP